MKIIAGSSNVAFAHQLAQTLGIELLEVDISRFTNREKRVWIKGEIRGENVIVVQSFSDPADEHIMEFLLITDALERLGARHINAAIPWLGYSLQDKVFREGEPIAAKVVANLISNAHVKRAFLLDLHNTSTTGFFSIPAHHLNARQIFAEYAKEHLDLSNAVIVSPDFGGIKRARTFAELLNLEMVNIDKHRNLHTGETTAMGMSGEVKGKTAIVIDDIINGGSTVVTAADFLRQQGAQQIHFFATHGPLVASAFEKLDQAQLDSVVVSNSIHHPVTGSKVKILDVSSLFADELKSWMGAKG